MSLYLSITRSPSSEWFRLEQYVQISNAICLTSITHPTIDTDPTHLLESEHTEYTNTVSDTGEWFVFNMFYQDPLLFYHPQQPRFFAPHNAMIPRTPHQPNRNTSFLIEDLLVPRPSCMIPPRPAFFTDPTPPVSSSDSLAFSMQSILSRTRDETPVYQGELARRVCRAIYDNTLKLLFIDAPCQQDLYFSFGNKTNKYSLKNHWIWDQARKVNR